MKKKKCIYLIGSLRNSEIPIIADTIRSEIFEVFDDWYSPGPKADDYWRDYEKGRGSDYKMALQGYAARHIFEFDKTHLDRSDIGILVLPAGKSCHMELGYLIGQGKPTYILFNGEPKDGRWDVMYCFAKDVFFNIEDLLKELEQYVTP